MGRRGSNRHRFSTHVDVEVNRAGNAKQKGADLLFRFYDDTHRLSDLFDFSPGLKALGELG